MSWRIVVISKHAKLELHLGLMIVRDESTVKIAISEISTLMIENTAVALTAALLSELLKNKVKVIFCDEKRNPQAELMPYYGSHDSSVKIKSQLAWTAECKQTVWTEIVREKIYRQAELLRANGCECAELLEQYTSELEPNDSTNREGHAAKVYFNALFGMSFTRSNEDPFNAALNYGYAILLSAFNREITAGGYLTQLGIAHDNMFNPFNFSCDLMEPYRPLVDQIVVSMLPERFEKEERLLLVNVLNKEVIIDGKRQFVNNAVKIFCKSVFDALNENDISLLRFYRNEL